MGKVIPLIFLEKAAAHKDKIAFNYFDQTWKTITYHEFLTYTKSLASYLIRIGIQKGDRVAIVSENRPEWCMAYLGISLSGGIAIPIDAQLGADEIKNLLADSETNAVFHSEKTSEHARKAAGELGAHFPLSVTLINLDSPDFKDILKTPATDKYPEVSEEDIASIIYTSGTTGKPKGVMLTHKNFCSDAEALIEAGILSHDDSVIGVLPLHHTYPFMGNCLIPVFLGISVSFPPSLKGPDIMATMSENGITILVSVPQLLELIRNGIFNKIKQLHGPLPKIMFRILSLCGSLRRKFSINPGKIIFKSVHRALGERFRFSACGGAKLDPEVMKDLEALGLTILEGYGLTETSPIVTFNPIEKRKAGSVGKPLPSAEVKIMHPENKKELGVLQEGEIVIRGPMVMKGYYKNPETTAEVLKEGWFYSGDIGYLDNDGYLFITGRFKEVIVLSSGKNIYPDEVEKQYLKIPLIKEICVMGLEGKGMVESLQAIVVPDFEYAKKAQIANLQETLKWEIQSISARLPQYMRIKGYTLYPEPLPRTPLGKLRRFMVKDLLSIKRGKVREQSEDKRLLQDEVGITVVECLKPLLKEQLPIQATDNLELDLGLDSLARIELVVALENAFSLKLPETFTMEIQTVEELITKVKEFGTAGIRGIEKMPVWEDILRTDPDLDERKKIGLQHGLLDRLIVFLGLGLVKIVLKVFFRLKAEGLENLPEKGPYIITPNHTSYLDAFCIGGALPSSIFTYLYSLGMQRFFTGRFGESFARLAHVIPIDTEIYLNKALQLSSYVLRNGKSLLIFPEGGRSLDGELMEFKKGVGILSRELDIPVVPACIKGAFEALPRGSAWPKFTGITVKFGKPLYPSDVDMSKKPEGMDNYQFFMNEVKYLVERLRR
jgi:long-chain acyl-CoA synthetase